ncbi:hypothetical protein FRB95_009534 [Tulasnella sp. JGI-2019a]|nr:hypothetical protein FRB95_009534 [Tulasnella sp. JGI-2019a]
MDDDDFNPSTLSGLGLDTILADLELPSSSSLGNQLGLTGLSSFTSGRIFSGFAEDGAIGVGEGDDFEDEVDREIQDEGVDADAVGEGDGMELDVKMEAVTPHIGAVAQSPGNFDMPMGDDEDLFGPEPPRKRPRKEKTRTTKKPVPVRPLDVKELFPSFEPGKILNFTELFRGRAIKKSRVKHKPFNVEPVAPKERELAAPRPLEYLVGDVKAVVQKSKIAASTPSTNPDAALLRAIRSRDIATSQDGHSIGLSIPLDDRSYDLVLLADWEKQIIYEPPTAPLTVGPLSLSNPTNLYLESDDWLQTIIWDRKQPFKDFRQLPYDPDPFKIDAPPSTSKPPAPSRHRKRLRFDNAVPKDQFNLSNDQFYEVSKEKSRVRQTFGQIKVTHAYPAEKLQLPFYKTQLSKAEARSWHRPTLHFPVNLPISFSKVRGAKKKKDKAGRKITRGDLTEGLRFTGDISLRDTSAGILLEYSEEYPPMLNSFGMGSVLVNYYRKRNEVDDYIPKLDVGEPYILEPADESPFFRHGHVHHGETVPAIYNKLYRAPLFRHKPAGTDFLVIRSTTKGESKYFIREIKTLFTVGQTFPAVEVPGPHSRKITNTIKGRLQIIAFKLIGKSREGRIKMPRLLKYFPSENELQMKQRLKPFIKEFMEFHRTGPHQGYWRLKTTIEHPTREKMLRIVEPENVVVSEGTEVGKQQLDDMGYIKADIGEEANDEEAATKPIAEQLAPWYTTKSFVSAATKGSFMKLHGEGDPTGRGEGFSFIRTSAKTPFMKAGEDPEAKEAEIAAKTKSTHRYTVADQHTAYRQEIDRIWKAQHDSLSNPIPPALSDEEDEPLPSHSISRRGSVQPGRRDRSPSVISERVGSRGMSVGFGGQGDGGSVDGRGGDAMSNRVLRIRRLIEGKWTMEIIRDQRVITAYVDRKRAEEEAMVDVEDVQVTGDAAVDARNAKRIQDHIAKMKKNQDRRLQRKNAQIIKAGGTPMGDMHVKSETTRKCGNCGQIGHMKTNRKCPRWAEFNTDSGPISAASPPIPSAASPPASAMSPPASTGFFAGPGSAFRSASFSFPSVPSPLATSPPLSAANEWYGDGAMSPGGSSSAPKKLTLKVRK